MQFFQNFDPEEKTSPETKLNIPERAAVMAVTGAFTMALRKARKCKTYGELYKVMNMFMDRVDSLSDEFEDKFGDLNEKSDSELEAIQEEVVMKFTALESEIETETV